uniref:Transcriptional protein SWT1 n=1 Tax=Acanthochromis polyacanthus TaxID=80966 RepID=A0A3Q1GP38_9TELE
MSKKSKKRRHKKSSSSSEEDEKVSTEQDGKRKKAVKSHERSHKEKEKSFPSTVKDDSQSSRQIKKPVYRLANTQATEQKPIKKEEQCTKTKSVSAPFRGENCSSKAKHDVSGKGKTVSGSKTVEREPSTHLNTSSLHTPPLRTEKTSKDRLDEKSSQRSPSKLRKCSTSPSSVSAEHKRRHDSHRRKHIAKEPSRTRNDSSTHKTWEPTSSSSKDSLEQRRRELVKDEHHRLQEKESKARRSLCAEAESSSASVPKTSSSLAKHTSSESYSQVLKKDTSVSWTVTSGSHKTAQSSSTQTQIPPLIPSMPPDFKIPKKVQPRQVDDNKTISTITNVKHGVKLSDSEKVSVSSTEQETVQQAHSCLDVAHKFEGQDKKSSLPHQLPATTTKPWHDQMQVVEELHLARSEKRLEVSIMQSYGELTCMDVDSEGEPPADTQCRRPPQQGLILVLDTNILLSHLDYVKKIRFHGLGALGFPVILIPWVVLQELDSLKRGKGFAGSVAHLATPAISYIYNSLKSREPHLWGQSMQQAAESINGLNAENNDDRVLQCCLQYQNLYPECALILCTNDKNLCSKGLLSGVHTLCKSDLESKVQRSRHGLDMLENIQAPMLPHVSPQVSSSMLSRSSTPVQPHSQEKAGCSVGLTEKDIKRLGERDEEKSKWDLRRNVSGLEDCLLEVLSDVLEAEMKAAYEDLWIEVVYQKPPWTLKDVLQCFKKHWIAVFGFCVPRSKLQTVLNLINFFNSGETVDCSTTSVAIQEAKELVKAFSKSSTLVPNAIFVMDDIFNKLQSQLHPSAEGESSSSDVVMNDDDEEEQPTPAQVSHQEVWAVFEGIWSKVYPMSLEVFKALGFDPYTMQSAQPVGGPPPPQDAVACLHKLSSMVSQLLQAFSSVLSSAPGLEEVQNLLSIIQSNKLTNEESRLTAKDLLDCFLQPDYREKLRVGGSQLMELQQALDRCVWATSQHTTFPM